jgi:hypothetical protein
MARFGRSFVQAATQPQYAQGLFTAAQQMGAAPGRRRQAQKAANLQKGLFGLEQSALAGDLTPEMYKEAVGSYTALMQQNPEQADEIRKSLARVGASVREQDKTQKGIGAKREINNLRNAALAVQKNRGLSTEDKQATLAKMKQELKRIQEANPNIDLTQFDGMFEDVVVEARQLNKAEDVARRDAKTRQISQALFQIKDLDALETATDKMLAGDAENAEAIKKFSSLQQQFILDKQERDRRIEERGYDVAGEVQPVRDRLKGVPQKLKSIVEDRLSAAEDEQKRYRKDGTWTNSIARKKAANLIDEAEDLINAYVVREVSLEQNAVAGLESELADIRSSGPGTPNRNDIKATQDTLAIRDYGRKFDELPSAKKQDIQKKAAIEEQEKLNNAYNAKLRATQAQLAALRGEEPEQVEPKEETSKFLEPVSKEAVAKARANGQTDAQIRRTFQKMGVDNARIIELLFD